MKVSASPFCVTDRGARMGNIGVAFTTLSWIEASKLNRNIAFSQQNTTHPAPKPSIKKYAMDFPRESVARTVVIKPKPTITIAQPIHICGRYRVVAAIDNPAMKTDGTIDEKASM